MSSKCSARVQASSATEVRRIVSRAVVRAHERLARDAAKQAGDDRELRMQALKANDFAAYEELLRQTKNSADVQEERCALLPHLWIAAAELECQEVAVHQRLTASPHGAMMQHRACVVHLDVLLCQELFAQHAQKNELLPR
jgi:hypothetical protein